MKTLALNPDEERILRNLIDGAARHFGSASAEAVLHFLRKLDQPATPPLTAHVVEPLTANVVEMSGKAAS
jgi:hypothetical protein